MSREKHKDFCAKCEGFLARVYAVYRGKPLPPEIAKIRAHLGLLLQAWSVMAGRNLMNDVLRELKSMDGALASDLKTASAEVQRTLARMLGTHVVGKSRYDSVLCLGYRVKTSGPSYQGDTDDYQDMQNRCEDLKAAIRSAHNLVSRAGKPATEKNVLKIFMAPEFYFRGRKGAYDFGDVNGQQARNATPGVAKVDGKSGILELMEQEIGKPEYKDWLFVLGTAICATKITVCKECKGEVKWTGKSSAVCKLNGKHNGTTTAAEIDNVAFVVKEGAVHTFSKELVSHIDFVMSPTKKDVVRVSVDGKSQQLPVLKVDQPSNYTAATAMPTKFKDERMGGSIFTIDGVTFGLEVCLDHAATTSSNGTGRLNHAANIQVQLIPSAGMDIKKLQTVAGGIVFNVDGATPYVQIVAGHGSTKVGARQEIRYDLVNGGEHEFAFTGAKPGNFTGKVDDLVKNHGSGWTPVVGATKETPTLPKLAHGNSGSVLMYGPYELPAV